MEAYLDYQKGGTGGKLNDIIEDFKYVYKGQLVKAGDFVNYINGVAGIVDYGTSTDTAIETQWNTNDYTGYVISAAALDDNRIFIAHSWASACYLHGVVVTINGTTITAGTDTRLDTTTGKAKYISAVTLENGNVFVAHNEGSYDVLCGKVCEISGTSIVAGADYSIDATNYSGRAISTVGLGDNKVFIAHNSSNKYYLHGRVVKIDGTTISTYSYIVLSSGTNAGHTVSAQLLPNGNVFVAHSCESSYYLYGIVCAMSGTSMTKGTDTALSTTSNTGGRISATTLTDGNVLVAHRGDASEVHLYAIACTISDKAITTGTDTLISNTSTNAGLYPTAISLPNNKVLIMHGDHTAYLYGIVCTISGTTIAKGIDTQLNSEMRDTAYAKSLLLLNNGSIFVAHSYSTSYYLYAQIFAIDEANNIPTNHITATEYETQVTPATESPFNAIALSSGEGGTDTEHKDQVKIARVYKEITKEGNMFPTTWEQVTAGTKYSSADGYVIETDSFASSSNYAKFAVDNDTSTSWQSVNGVKNFYIKMTCPMPKKITKMKVRFNIDGSNNVSYIRIQGSKDGETWNDVYYTTSNLTALTEVTLKNTDYYKYYKIVGYPQQTGAFYVYEWQTSEYVEVIT